MPRRTVILVTCSFCSAEGPEENYEQFKVVWNRDNKTALLDVQFDLCKQCLETNDSVLYVLTAGQTVRAEKRKKKSEQQPTQIATDEMACGYEGCDFVGKTLAGRGLHRNRAHGINGASKTPKTTRIRTKR